ncbi:MAG: hypothetical protein PHW18_09605 [Sulfuricurvum sp.]|uniref:hypothetical protein n=1 Tax=Sulfuricurvum sp. TaxID=2025608 RepID=UPI0026124C68|nr:hypothetical protein [Sulfuricurvum sp.]MDD2829814.1 hypothetical protein [Sulfuricurvum sp.]MDD4950277.1 hypothetical protein [Sulfuricurvum sp.]
MSLIHNEIIQLSALYWVLSMLMVLVTLSHRKQIVWIGIVSVGLMVYAGWSMGMKWVLVGSFLCMAAAMVFSFTAIVKQSRECINELKNRKEENKNESL